MFFILSGALLVKNYKDNFSLRSFYTKRFLKIEIPQMIGFFCAFALMYCLNANITQINISGFLVSLLGLGYSGSIWYQMGVRTTWVIGEWFTAVIIICYLLFPLLRHLFLKYRWYTSVVITTIFALNLKYEILTYGNGWFSITNGLMCFWLGMFFEEYKTYLKNNKLFYADLLFCIAFYFFAPYNILKIRYLPCFFFSLSLFYALYRVNYSDMVTQYICKYNYEIYLVHHRVYILFLPALLNTNSNGTQIFIASVLVLLLTFLLSETLQKISNYLIKTGEIIFSRQFMSHCFQYYQELKGIRYGNN